MMQFGDVVLVKFPFTNQVAFKQRPAVVVSSAEYNTAKPDVIIMAITSQLRQTATLGEVWLREWQSAGLLKPSAIKPVFATVEQGLILRTIGSLSGSDQSFLRDMLVDLLR